MRVFNKKYWPHQVRLNGKGTERSVDLLERWCYDNFKSANWTNIGYYFVFKREQDLTFFSLRWS